MRAAVLRKACDFMSGVFTSGNMMNQLQKREVLCGHWVGHKESAPRGLWCPVVTQNQSSADGTGKHPQKHLQNREKLSQVYKVSNSLRQTQLKRRNHTETVLCAELYLQYLSHHQPFQAQILTQPYLLFEWEHDSTLSLLSKSVKVFDNIFLIENTL